MKKILPYIFILTIIVQFFAPFSVGIGKKGAGVTFEKNTASAVYEFQIDKGQAVSDHNSITFN
ncbi:MAG: hypothetical protein PHW20_10000, partial [Clostridia bacterium]|nr:hypothetical protein [Clostridia bacterium]